MRTALLVHRDVRDLDTVAFAVQRAGLVVGGTTSSSRTALQLVERLEPDLLVTGLRMPDEEMTGIALVRAARGLVSDLRAIVVASSAEPADVESAFEAGACAYVVRTAHVDDIASAVRQAFEHSIYFASSPVAGATLVPVHRSANLTPRELEILLLVAQGHTNAELARMLWVTEQTIKFHLSNVYRKIRVSNRTEAGRWAHQAGLVPRSAGLNGSFV